MASGQSASMEEILQQCYDATNKKLKITISGLTVTNDGTKTTLATTVGDYFRIGDAGTTGHTLNSEDDLLITGDAEIDGTLFLDGDSKVATTKAIYIYNTADQITDYEYGRIIMTGNNLTIDTAKGGSGTTLRSILIGSSAGGGVVLRSAAATAMNIDAGGNFVFRDVDDSYATRLTIDSATGNITATGASDMGTSCEANAYTVGGTAGIDESGSGTISSFTITIVKGIVTAFAKVS